MFARDDTDWGKAVAAIRERICALPEFAHARSQALTEAIDVCRYHTVAEMRELGGFSEVIRRRIDALPDKYRHDYGSQLLPRSVVDILREFIPQLRGELQWNLSQCESDEELQLPYWRKRGEDDSRAGQLPLFRNTRRLGIHGIGDVPDDWTEEGERARGAAYLAGYEAAGGFQSEAAR